MQFLKTLSDRTSPVDFATHYNRMMHEAGALGTKLRSKKGCLAINLEKRLYRGFHSTMCCVYLGVIGSELAGWYAARDAILLSGVAVCGIGLLIWVFVSTGCRRPLRHVSLVVMQRPCSTEFATDRLIPAHQTGTCDQSQRPHTLQSRLETEAQLD